MRKIGFVQLGKNGITENFIESLRAQFNNLSTVKVNVLKNAGHDKKNVKEVAEKLVDALGKNYTFRVIGFTISIKKWKKEKR